MMKGFSVATLAGVMLLTCGQPALAAQHASPKEKVLHSFGNGTDGQNPISLLDVKGSLFGTTYSGGASGGGAVFELNPNTGAESVLYSFCSQTVCADGQAPEGGLINMKGMLYGTTSEGGVSGNGTVYALDPGTGAEMVLYSFCSQQNCIDGASPYGNLIDVKGTLYGTTSLGGANGYYTGGTIYSLNPETGAETVLYSFCSQQNCTDGQGPNAGVVDIRGILYGTTGGGGSSGSGTVFALDLGTGTERVLHSFCSQQNCADGEFPYASLINVKGTLYSTTVYGGANRSGTVFALDPSSGAESVLYSFCKQLYCTDGGLPYASVIDVDGTLYGTTIAGGTQQDQECTIIGSTECGTVFAINRTTGAETVLYSFCIQQNCTDGSNPLAGLILTGGKLYGATYTGGTYGFGTVFELKKWRE